MTFNNIHFDFPPIMSEGGNYASWQPGSSTNKAIREKAGIMNNSQYRKYLISNADKIIKANQLEACDNCSSTPSQFGSSINVSPTPFLYSRNVEDNPIGFEKSDLKSNYLARHQIEKTQVTPVMTQEHFLKLQR